MIYPDEYDYFKVEALKCRSQGRPRGDPGRSEEHPRGSLEALRI